MTFRVQLTLLIYLLPGTPKSLANDHRRRDAVAIIPIAAAIKRARMIEAIAVAPPLLLVACAKISMNGKPVGLASASSTLPMQKRMAISIAKPIIPLTVIDTSITRGTTVDALWISSAIVSESVKVLRDAGTQ